MRILVVGKMADQQMERPFLLGYLQPKIQKTRLDMVLNVLQTCDRTRATLSLFDTPGSETVLQPELIPKGYLIELGAQSRVPALGKHLRRCLTPIGSNIQRVH